VDSNHHGEISPQGPQPLSGPSDAFRSVRIVYEDVPDPDCSGSNAPSIALSNSNYVRVQVLTPVGALDRDKQLGVVKELTEIVAAAAGDPTLMERTWVLITESPEGGWGIAGHANTQADIVAQARAAATAG
jgi:phenylpyruvate tautomerase PptA (4-oxalocrotonate tautomerase family)